jgi:hypothetical protein
MQSLTENWSSFLAFYTRCKKETHERLKPFSKRELWFTSDSHTNMHQRARPPLLSAALALTFLVASQCLLPTFARGGEPTADSWVCLRPYLPEPVLRFPLGAGSGRAASTNADDDDAGK